MFIQFNCLRTGLGNGGGSNTILRCQQTLKELGHRCEIVATLDRFTWFKHDTPKQHLSADADWIIATGVHSFDSTLHSRTNHKAWYIRGHETWIKGFDENVLVKMYKNSHVHMVSNSTWMKKFIENQGGTCNVIFQGIDCKSWIDNTIKRDAQDKVTIGCLYGAKASKHWDHFLTLKSLLGDKYNYMAYGLKAPKEYKGINFFTQPGHNLLNNIYLSCHIWFAPTSQEGLHNVPMEAALCGCRIVCSDDERNGMGDYASEHTAYIYSDSRVADAADIIKDVNFQDNKVENMKNRIINHIGDRKHNMKKMINLLHESSH